MTETRYRFREFTLVLDIEPEREPVTHLPQCEVCDAEGPEFDDEQAVTRWVFAHARNNPGHHTYRTRVTVPQRLIPGAWK